MIKPLTYKELIKILKDHGFTLKRQKGSHQIYKNDKTNVMVIVPLHGKNKPIKIGTFKAIVKQSGINAKQFDKS